MDTSERIEDLKKYLKYGLLIIPIIIIIIVLKGCGGKSYSALENSVKEEVLSYIKERNLNIVGEQYIELSMLNEIEGTELCSVSSGAIVKNENGNLVVTPYLDCQDYKSESLKSSGKYIELNGDAIVLLNRGEVFNDPLYVLKKDSNVEVDGAVGSAVGVYTIKYMAYVNNDLKETLYRKVIVTAGDHTKTISGIENLDYPTLTLNGDTEIILVRGEKYKEAGYTAIDYTDGKIGRRVKVDPEVIDTSKIGSYDVIYSVTNSKGNTAIKKRHITIVARKANLDVDVRVDENITNKATITITVAGEGYESTELPDHTNSIKRVTTYAVKSNGRYPFVIKDVYGNSITKEVTIENIDNTPPIGKCKAVVTSSSTTVTVEASDNKGISGYSYIIDNKKTEYMDSNTYEESVSASSVYVRIKDVVGNETAMIPCQTEKKTTNIIAGACGESDIYITINTCYGNKLIRKDVPLEEYLLGVLYGEEAPGMNDSVEYIKTFLIFARSYTLNRIGYWSGGAIKPIKSCSSDQNWCDVDMGCYRDQTQEMFDLCIDYAVSYPRPTYTAQTCADRVTTFPGSANVSNKTFYVHNSGWWGDSSATSTHTRSSWHGPVTEEKKAFYLKLIEETAGLIIYDSSGSPAYVNYYLCDDTSKESTLCPNTAEKLANQGYSMNQLIEAYTQKYPGRTVGCYKKN